MADQGITWPSFNWEDPLLLEAALSDEERMVRDTARAFAEESLAPIVLQANRLEQCDRALMMKFGEQGLLGATLQGYGCPGVSYVAYGLIAREVERVDFGLSFGDVRAIEPGDVADPCLRHRRSAAALSAQAGERRMDRLFRSDRTGCRIGPRLDADDCQANGSRLCPERGEDVDHLFAVCRCLRDLGQVRRTERIRGFILERGDKGCPRPRSRASSRCAPG